MKKCVVYFRVSSSEQEDSRQFEDVELYCANNDFEIVEVFRETISGALKQRKEMTNMLSYIDLNNIKYLIISEIERLGRTSEVVEIIETLTTKKVCLITLKENLHTLNEDFTPHSDNAFLVDIYVALSKKELSSLKYRIKSGTNNCVLKGGWYGGKYLPFGYMLSEDKKLIINPSEAETVKLIFNKYEDNWGSVKIANFLNQNNVKTRLNKYWVGTTINGMLVNPIYTGKRKWKGDLLDFEELRIIDTIQFENAGNHLKQRKNRNYDYSKIKRYSYLFDKRMIKCSICGSYYEGIYKINRYRCHSGKSRKGCGNHSVKLDYLENEIQLYLFKNYFSLIKDKTKLLSDNLNLEQDLALLKAEQLKMINKTDRYKELFANGMINMSELTVKLNSNNELLIKINDNIRTLSERIKGNKDLKTVIANQKLNYIGGKLNLESTNIDKATLTKIIKCINVNTIDSKQTINVELVNGNTFTL